MAFNPSRKCLDTCFPNNPNGPDGVYRIEVKRGMPSLLF